MSSKSRRGSRQYRNDEKYVIAVPASQDEVVTAVKLMICVGHPPDLLAENVQVSMISSVIMEVDKFRTWLGQMDKLMGEGELTKDKWKERLRENPDG